MTAADPEERGSTSEGGAAAPEPPAEPAVAERPADFRTFLIADIRGYTSYTDERGDEAAAALANQFAGLVREVVSARDGVLVELRGDEALTVFTSARQALRAAVEIQNRITADRLPRGVGIGLDAGEAVPVEGGYRGTALNVAARLCAQARAGEILATETVIHLAARIDGIRYREPKSVRLKGFESPFRVVGVEPIAGTALATAGARRPATPSLSGRPAVAALVAVAVLVVGGALVFAQGLGGRGSAAPGSTGAAAGGGSSAAPGGSPVTGPGGSPAASPGEPGAPAADVPMYKGGLGRTNQMPGPALGATPGIRWQSPTGANPGGTPAVAGNLVFAGGSDGTLHVLDLVSGQEAWTFAAGAPILSTPAVVDGSVYVATDDGVFHAVDLTTHAERWRVPGIATGTVPTVDGESAYVGLTTGRFAALSVTDGREQWHVDVDGAANRAAVADGTAYVDGDGSDRLYAIDLTDHTIRWSVATGTVRSLTPAVDGGTVYVAALDVSGKNSRILALDAATGKEQWAFRGPKSPESDVVGGRPRPGRDDLRRAERHHRRLGNRPRERQAALDGQRPGIDRDPPDPRRRRGRHRDHRRDGRGTDGRNRQRALAIQWSRSRGRQSRGDGRTADPGHDLRRDRGPRRRIGRAGDRARLGTRMGGRSHHRRRYANPLPERDA